MIHGEDIDGIHETNFLGIIIDTKVNWNDHFSYILTYHTENSAGCWCDLERQKPWATYQIRKIADCAYAGNAGNVFPATAV